MALGVAGAIVEAIMNGPEGAEHVAISIAGIKPDDPGKLLLPERTFQYWPETISDTIEIGWNFKDIPGASHALAQWASNGGRTIAFEVQFSRFMKPKAEWGKESFFEKINDPIGLTTPNQKLPSDQRPHNVDIAAEIRYLRSFCYPTYKDVKGYTTAFPPPIAVLAIPKLELSESGPGGNVIFAVMTGCDATHTLLFPDGTPRKATVALTFKQVVQDPYNQGIFFAGHGENAPTKIMEGGLEEEIAAGGARPKNDLDSWSS